MYFMLNIVWQYDNIIIDFCKDIYKKCFTWYVEYFLKLISMLVLNKLITACEYYFIMYKEGVE